MSNEPYNAVPQTEVTRLGEKQVRERGALDALLDEARVGHVGVVRSDGTPLVIPTAVARDGDRVLLHGSTGSPWLRLVAGGAPVSVAVTSLDGLVFARSAFESSMHYRSAVLFGVCRLITDPVAKGHALDVLTDALMPGRVAEVRRPNPKELAATQVLELAIKHWSLKVSAGWPEDPPADVEGPTWAGVVPLRPVFGAPVDAPDLRDGIEPPASVRAVTDQARPAE